MRRNLIIATAALGALVVAGCSSGGSSSSSGTATKSCVATIGMEGPLTGPVAVLGPAGSQEVEAVGPLFARSGIAFISGSATAAALTTGKYPTFFRTVSKDSVQGPQDANYIVNNLHPKALMIVDDQEAYSTGLVSA